MVLTLFLFALLFPFWFAICFILYTLGLTIGLIDWVITGRNHFWEWFEKMEKFGGGE